MSTELLAPPSEREEILTPQAALVRAFNKNPTAEMAKQIVELQQSSERFQWEREERQAKIDFDNALSRIQAKISSITPDRENKGVRGNAWYLSYKKLDSVVRPLYTVEGFSLAFGEEDCPVPGKIRVVAHLSRGGITRHYRKDITPPLLGPKGEPVMTQTHGDTSANSYARRYLVYDIFNIAVGLDKDDDDGNGGTDMPQMEPGAVADYIAGIEGARDLAERQKVIASANTAILEVGDRNALIQFFIAALACATTKEVLVADWKWMCGQVDAHAPKRLQEAEKTSLTAARDRRRAQVN